MKKYPETLMTGGKEDENPYKKGTANFRVWQDGYQSGKIDGCLGVTMAHLNAKTGDSRIDVTCKACNGTGYDV